MSEFWRDKTLEEMTPAEWESLCDDCGLCCLVRVEDEDTSEVHETNVICRHYSCENWKCGSYANRASIENGCVKLTPELVREFDWLPDSCAYRTVLRGDDLPAIHPLVNSKAEIDLVRVEGIRQIAEQVGLVQDDDTVVHEHHLIKRIN